MTKDFETNDEVCEKIDTGLNDLMDSVMDQYPNQSVVGEMFLCLAQFAAELAAHGGASEDEFADSCRALFRQVNAAINPAPRKLDPSLN